jgi:hypothetical protein
MPTYINREVSIDDVQSTLANTLGPGYHVHASKGDRSKLTVTHNILRATVSARSEGGGTTFKVHGSGFILWRIPNQLLLATKIKHALEQGFKTTATTL